MRRAFLTAALLCAFASPAQALSIDISDAVIRVTTGFTGADLTVFGTQDKPGAIVIVVEGPPKVITVRKKSSVLGLWTNTDSRRFKNVPAFYEVAATAPLDSLTTPDVLTEKHIGTSRLPIIIGGDKDDPDTTGFLVALYQGQQDKHLFVPEIAPIAYPGPNLFKARFNVPAIVPPGQYKVSAYLFQDGKIVEENSVPFVIIPEGLSAQLRRFATQNGLLYGLCGMLMAIFAGWLATVLLKRD